MVLVPMVSVRWYTYHLRALWVLLFMLGKNLIVSGRGKDNTMTLKIDYPRSFTRRQAILYFQPENENAFGEILAHNPCEK
jgi:hypothetical protein